MPCSYYTPSEWQEIQGQETAKQREILKKELDKVADLLCHLCQDIESGVLDCPNECAVDMPEYVKPWWEEHKKTDAECRAREQAEIDKKKALEKEAKDREKAKKAALKKLTPEEKKLLGL